VAPVCGRWSHCKKPQGRHSSGPPTAVPVCAPCSNPTLLCRNEAQTTPATNLSSILTSCTSKSSSYAAVPIDVPFIDISATASSSYRLHHLQQLPEPYKLLRIIPHCVYTDSQTVQLLGVKEGTSTVGCCGLSRTGSSTAHTEDGSCGPRVLLACSCGEYLALGGHVTTTMWSPTCGSRCLRVPLRHGVNFCDPQEGVMHSVVGLGVATESDMHQNCSCSVLNLILLKIRATDSHCSHFRRQQRHAIHIRVSVCLHYGALLPDVRSVKHRKVTKVPVFLKYES